MRLGELIAELKVRPGRAYRPDLRVCDLTEDSRTVVPGSLFVARPGTKTDGRRYIAQAAEAGAVAVLVQRGASALDLQTKPVAAPDLPILECDDAAHACAAIAERFYGNPSSRLALVGITGTNGKSTIAHLVHRAMNAIHRRTGLIGTVEIDDGLGLAPAEMTTPPSSEISRTLGVMVEQGCTAAAMEVSSHALDQKRVEALRFKAAVFTNLTRDHLNYHQTMERYADAKAHLFELLSPDAIAIVNASDPAWRRMVRDCRASVLRCALEAPAGSLFDRRPEPAADAPDALASVRAASLSGTRVQLRGPWGSVDLASPLIGNHNAMNLLQAAACLWSLGVPADNWARALERVGPPAGRLERVSTDAHDIAVFVDYAHTPDAIDNVLTAVRAVAETRPITIVFGAGGDKDQGKRPLMGEAAARLADHIVLTSDNPRSEPPRAIINQILEGIPAHARDRMDVHVDRERAIHAAIAQAAQGQIIIIAGKGHEREQVALDDHGITTSRPFDDREIARHALALRRPG